MRLIKRKFIFLETKMRSIIKFIFLLSFLLSFSEAKMNNKKIEEIISEYLIENKVNNSFHINKKLRLPTCEGNINIENRFGDFKTLLIKCNGNNKWSYNVRTNLKIDRIKKNKKTNLNKGKNVYVVKLDLKRRHILRKEDIEKKNIRNLGGNNFFLNDLSIIGRELKMPLKKNQIIRERHLVKNWTIQEGQKVIIENNRNKINIMVDGIATKSAMAGEYLEVLNKSTGKTIKAWVINSKKVSIFR